mmetsp:Transcript_34419/g.76474  ORF Transcript_34419/g.76474 Transcript_34419/m.76474 type:complete len:176 (+) Transcript_34419:52-579(+)|eukprot:CAMPEP_0202902070 /NCGR_PEP_ID=MMETSP1392-20130828/16161_1 /ASSEMBLY_ACC=CAM_ASM_000868 /TAXON_ID=225041 /ORGANISM="Chlamydomonas chlamydogama, Strain SAG 11-48b" /LENGTH=175 /DNA_ID=CAMNT_0049588753 /DNA_START=766 /DNA_END=855 /DNA_ORIENTATION=+
MGFLDRVPSSVGVLSERVLGNHTLLTKYHGKIVEVEPESVLKDKYVLFLFGSCTAGDSFFQEIVFKLSTSYLEHVSGRRKHQRQDQLEIVFVSNDRDAANFDFLYGKMPWTAIPFHDPRRESVRKLFKVVELPKAIVVAPDGAVINRQAIKNIILDVDGSRWPYLSRPDTSCFCV